MVITRSFDVALNGRGYTALPKVNEKWRAAMTAALEEEKKKLWKNVLCNHLSNALHKKTRTLLRAIVVARACAAALVHGLGFFLATQTANQRRQYLNCRVAETTILVFNDHGRVVLRCKNHTCCYSLDYLSFSIFGLLSVQKIWSLAFFCIQPDRYLPLVKTDYMEYHIIRFCLLFSKFTGFWRLNLTYAEVRDAGLESSRLVVPVGRACWALAGIPV